MTIQLIDRSKDMCEAWKDLFDDCQDVVVHCGDFFSLPTDCIVSPANSFGFMDGGLDLYISERLGWQVQERLQAQIKEKYFGELLVGQAELVETGVEEVPYCISAPTMRVPLVLEDTVNVFLAAKAIFYLLKEVGAIKKVTISGLGTGVGRVPYGICAYQMRRAYDDIWLEKNSYPDTWYDAALQHKLLF